MRKNAAVLLATGSVVGSAIVGSRFTPASARNAAWYAWLDKPRFRPSGPVIGAAWSVLDVLLAYSGTKLLEAPPSPAKQAATAGWATAVSGLALYPWLMFGRHRNGWALAAVVGMLGGTLTAATAGAQVDKRAANALVPLVGWLLFAGVLQEELWRRNR